MVVTTSLAYRLIEHLVGYAIENFESALGEPIVLLQEIVYFSEQSRLLFCVFGLE
jgi:hypothetical protein